MKEIISGIYCIENIINKKKYIGCSVDIDSRKLCHTSSLNRNNHENSYLQNAWNKYGKEKFKFYLIQECPKELFNDLEIEIIEYYNTTDRDFGYNISNGGNIPPNNKGIPMKEETKEKLRKINLGRKMTPEDVEKIKIASTGRRHTEETKKRLGENTTKTKLGKKGSIGKNSHVGVTNIKNKNKPYTANISYKGVRYWLGNFKTIDEAILAYRNKYFELTGTILNDK